MGLIDRAYSGDLLALSRLLTLVENRDPLGREALERLYPVSGRAHRIGITGPPGAGKSSLIHHLVAAFRDQHRKVAVIAVDPSSRMSGGATLGDRIRLLAHFADPGVFVRSMASRGQRGGLSAATVDVAHVLDAFGFDPVVIETLGIGQDEIDIDRVVDTTVLVQVPGLGDAIQTLKAGIMEIGDIIAVNKADLPGAGPLARDLRSMLAMGAMHGDSWIPPVLQVSAESGVGMRDLVGAISSHRSFLSAENRLRERRRAAAFAEIEAIIRVQLEQHFARNDESTILRLVEAVANRQQTPYSVATRFAERSIIDATVG